MYPFEGYMNLNTEKLLHVDIMCIIVDLASYSCSTRKHTYIFDEFLICHPLTNQTIVCNIFSNRRIRLNCNKFRAYKSIFRRSRKMIFQPVHCFDIIFFLTNIMIINSFANKRFISK